jgi:outer membrane immunogenic protein
VLTTPRVLFLVALPAIGYNWRLAPSWVLGVEADWQFSRERSTSSVAGNTLRAVTTTTTGEDDGGSRTTATITQIANGYADDERINSIGTARVRFGWVQDSFLLYLTGGAAWAEIKDNYTLTSSLPVFPSPTVVNFSTTKSGWTIGPGAEFRLVGNWTAKLEYLFVDLGSVNHIFTTSRTAAGTFAVFDSSHNIQDHIVRIGLNYKLW